LREKKRKKTNFMMQKPWITEKILNPTEAYKSHFLTNFTHEKFTDKSTLT